MASINEIQYVSWLYIAGLMCCSTCQYYQFDFQEWKPKSTISVLRMEQTVLLDLSYITQPLQARILKSTQEY